MNDQLPICKEETITRRFPRVLNQILLFFIGQFWQIIDKLTLILGLWHAKGKFKLKLTQQSVFIPMPLKHDEIFDWLI